MKFLTPISIVSLLLQAPHFSAADDVPADEHYEDPAEENVPEIPITPIPTAMPSFIPTEYPTKAPSESPSAVPSPIPSTAPTLSPSSAPSNLPSRQPTNDPSSSPSISPSFTPSDGPSPAPSSSPSEEPSASPTRADCESMDGSFGSFPSEDAIVEFSYEVEVDSLMDANAIQENIIPPLENAIVDIILPAVFKDQCDHSSRRLRLQRRLSEIKGISKYPEDIIYEDYACRSTAEGNSCVVVSGELTIFAEDQGTLSTDTETVKKAIEVAMESGALSDTQEDVVRVTYVEVDPEPNPANETPGGNDDGNKPIAISPVPFIIGGALLLALLVGIAYRQQKKNSNPDSTTQAGGSQVESQADF
eukprot:scaffold1734_cov196-Cylindrotheca_fusiformis.AAC.2